MIFPIQKDALDDRLAVVGTAGSGKTYLTLGAAEHLLARKSRIIFVDRSITVSSGINSISGTGMPDQWGNPWLQVDAATDKAIVSIFDCSGKSKIIGEVPMASLGSENNFAGFKPYMNATLQDLAAVSIQASWEKRCMEQGRRGGACEPNPHRYDCRVVEEPTNSNGTMIPADAWKAYQLMHGKTP